MQVFIWKVLENFARNFERSFNGETIFVLAKLESEYGGCARRI
jgi:hypothetical protein